MSEFLFEKYRNEPARDPVSLAKRTDPSTSHEAAADLIQSGKLGKQSAAVFQALERYGPCTSAELADRSGLDRHLVARRLPDLLKRHRVTRGDARACSVTGKRALVWKVA